MYMYPDKYDFVVFADVSKGTRFDEHAKTYWFIDNYIKPFCEDNGMEFVSVEPEKSLYNHCVDEKIIPTREMRWCTDRSKMQPIFKWAREMGATKNEPFLEDIGFSYDEYWRAGKLDPPKYLIYNTPLVDDKITREQCKKVILDKIGFLPPKSGCVYCPHAKKTELRSLRLDPDDKLKIPMMIDLEKNNARYPEITLKNKTEQIRGKRLNVPMPLENIIGVNEHTMDEYFGEDEDDMCESGYCFL